MDGECRIYANFNIPYNKLTSNQIRHWSSAAGPRRWPFRTEFTLAAIAQNLRRLAKLIAGPPLIASTCAIRCDGVYQPRSHEPALSLLENAL